MKDRYEAGRHTSMGLNLGWLLPGALLAARYPGQAQWILAGALAPLAVAVVYAGAGRPERGAAPYATPGRGSKPSVTARSGGRAI